MARHVAGLIALSAPNAKIVPYRVLTPMASATSGCWLRQCRRRLTRTAAPRHDDGAHVINLSLGTPLRMKVPTSIAALHLRAAGRHLIRCSTSRTWL